jgi:hypothetical protein
MSHSPSRHQVDKHYKRLAEEHARRQAELDEANRTYAGRIVDLWNARVSRRDRRPSMFPTIDTAITAGTPFLTSVCPGCGQETETDLRQVDRHPHATIATLIEVLSCSRCIPNAPFARLVELAPAPWSVRARNAKAPPA